jgi:hypothetical protein
MKSGPILLEFDIILPSQFVSTLRRQGPSMKGEHQLLIAMLEDAIHCYQRHICPRNKNEQRLFDDAEQWIMRKEAWRVRRSRDEVPGFSFENVCEALGLDADYIRAGLQRWRNAQRPVAPVRRQGMEFPG